MYIQIYSVAKIYDCKHYSYFFSKQWRAEFCQGDLNLKGMKKGKTSHTNFNFKRRRWWVFIIKIFKLFA